MHVTIHFYSYLKDLTGRAQAEETLVEGSQLGALHDRLMTRFPKLAAMKNSTLLAVGVEYQPRDYVLRDGDVVALFRRCKADEATEGYGVTNETRTDHHERTH